MLGSPSHCLDATMDRFGGVRSISVAAVFRRRSRHSHYMITMISTVEQLWLCEAQECLQSISGEPGTAFHLNLNSRVYRKKAQTEVVRSSSVCSFFFISSIFFWSFAIDLSRFSVSVFSRSESGKSRTNEYSSWLAIPTTQQHIVRQVRKQVCKSVIADG